MMRNSWKKLAGVSLLAAGLAIGGCSSEKEAGGTQAAGGGVSAAAAKGQVSVVVQDRGSVASTEGSYESNRWTKWIKDTGPVDPTFVPVLRSESKKLLNMMFASGSAPDIINETNAAFRNNIYEQKQLLPLDDLLQYMPNYKALMDEYPQLKQVGTKPDGKLYEMGRVNEANPLHILFIRTDWLKELGLEMPKTTEELLQVAQAFADKDPDKNGKRDTYGINISYYSDGAVNELFGIQQEHSWGLQDGKIVRQWDKELAALTFKKQLYEQGAIDRDYISDKDGTKAKQDFLTGKLGIYVNYSVSWFEFTTKDLVTLKGNVPTAVVEPLAYPKSPFGQYTGAIDNPIQMTTVFNANTKNPQAAAEYINFILEPSTTEMLLKGEKGVHWTEGDNGCAVIPDADKWQTEAGYAGGYGLFLSRGTDKCNFVANQFDPGDPVQKEGLDMYLKAKDMYLDPTKEYPGFTLGDHIPGLSSDLDVIRTNTLKEITDIYVKAVVNGKGYSAEQAVKDAKAAWEKAGGQKIIDFMNEWYETNKDTAFLSDDIWTIVEQQKELAK
ncbi:extracellular solute-binding protein [Paenibacillus sp. BIHB 4019]|nr:extracellular solute-binding protein [Paenibacillus sp. BIHB 4019]